MVMLKDCSRCGESHKTWELVNGFSWCVSCYRAYKANEAARRTSLKHIDDFIEDLRQVIL